MTKARLRVCTNAACKANFYKTEGCNKMTCPRCQWHMCYLCRANIPSGTGAGAAAHVPGGGYAHFCQTPHCQHASCKMCPLFTDPIEDDRRAMRAAAEAAKRAAEAAAAAAAAASSSSSSSCSSSSSSSSSSAGARYIPIAPSRRPSPTDAAEAEVS
jgi:hypothetical protein